MLIGPDGERWVAVGELVGAHGVRGEARLRPFNPDSSVIAEVSEVALVPAQGSWESKRVERARPHGTRLARPLNGVATPEAARSLAGRRVAVRERDLPALGAGQFYCYELIGLDVVDDSGESIGTVSEVLVGRRQRPARGRCRRAGAARFRWSIRMVTAVDLDRRRIVVRPVPGLLD